MKVLVLEPFYHGSHKYLCDVLESFGKDKVRTIGLEGKSKWHWRMLTSAAHFANEIKEKEENKVWLRDCDSVIFSAMMNVAELVGLIPAFATKRKIIFFHENQLEYPKSVSDAKSAKGQSDFNLVWNQVISCIRADVIYFNSEYNMKTFLDQVGPFLNRIPKANRPPNVTADSFRGKCHVMYLPITMPLYSKLSRPENKPLHIVWAHRWEHDKGNSTLMELINQFDSIPTAERSGKVVSISVLGEVYSSVEKEFEQARLAVPSNVDVLHWGRVDSREEYISILREADVAISTSVHEFFGISMVEAATCGCLPVCPKRLSYPELFPKDCLYNTLPQLFKLLRSFIKAPSLPRKKMQEESWHTLLHKFQWYSSNSDQSSPDGPMAKAWTQVLNPSS